MSVDTGITSSASKVLVLSVWDMEVGLGITVLLCKTKVNHIDLVSTLANAHEEVVRLDIAVDEGLGMDVFDAGDKLISEEQHRLEGEFAVAEVEQILQARSKKIKDHCVVITLGSEPAHERNPNAASQRLVDTGFIFELRVLCFDAFELDGNLLTRDDVRSEIDVTETAGAYLAADAVFVADPEILFEGSVVS